jgi:hypothetical protein
VSASMERRREGANKSQYGCNESCNGGILGAVRQSETRGEDMDRLWSESWLGEKAVETEYDNRVSLLRLFLSWKCRDERQLVTGG